MSEPQCSDNKFDMFRLTKSKRVVDLCPNTIRGLAKAHKLTIYKVGKTAWVSKRELDAVLRAAAVSGKSN